MNQFDHFVLAAPDLDAAKAAFTEATGCEPADGGAHLGVGTRNALCSFGNAGYLEIIAPDPEQSLPGTRGEAFGQLRGLTPLHWAVRSTDLPAVAEQARALGFRPSEIRDMSRQQPDGIRLDWRLMGLGGHQQGGFVPFFIDWLDCPHPSQTTPVVGEASFSLRLPSGPLTTLLVDVGGVAIEAANSCSVQLIIHSARGDVTYEASALPGFSL